MNGDMNQPEETMPCKRCGRPTPYLGTQLCDSCWQVEGRLQHYLKSESARAEVKRFLEGLGVREITLDDWVDGVPDAWDYRKVLAENDVEIHWNDHSIDGEGLIESLPADYQNFSLSWKHGTMSIGQVCLEHALKAAALFVELWKRGVSASFADHLMDGYLMWLDLQEGKRLSFLAEIYHDPDLRIDSFELTREGLCTKESFFWATPKIIKELDVQPDEEIICTFSKRKKAPIT
jgi:ribosomal protein L37E